MSPLTDRLSAAKLWLISQGSETDTDAPRDLPYLAHALYALTIVETPGATPISADQHWRVYVDPAGMADAAIPEIGRELAHLTWHLLMNHADRARSMQVDLNTAKHWHHACEITIHETLSGTHSSPTTVSDRARSTHLWSSGRLGTNQPAEGYYAFFSGLPPALPDGPEGTFGRGCGCGSCCCDGIQRSTELPADSDLDGITRVEGDSIRERVAIDYQAHAARSRGTAPLEALRWARGITNPTIAWEPLLARAVRSGIGWTSGRSEPTWTRPSRRQSTSPGILQPGRRRPVPGIALVVDTSGTIDDRLLGSAMAEVDGVIRGLGLPGASVSVLACDAAVGAVTRIRRAADARLVGGGGTDMRVGIAVASAQRPRPDLIVVFTDGYTPWPATPPPRSAVIAAMLGRPGDTLPGTPGWVTRVDCVLRS